MIKNLILLPWKTFTEYNKTGLTGIVTYPGSVWGGFIPLILVSLFIIILTGTYFTRFRFDGRGDFFESFAVAGYVTAVVSIMMSLVPGMINLITMTTSIVVAIVGTVLLFISKNKS